MTGQDAMMTRRVTGRHNKLPVKSPKLYLAEGTVDWYDCYRSRNLCSNRSRSAAPPRAPDTTRGSPRGETLLLCHNI